MREVMCADFIATSKTNAESCLSQIHFLVANCCVEKVALLSLLNGENDLQIADHENIIKAF